MDEMWNAHRFSGGALALDFANTVIYRDDAKRRTDRLSGASDISAFAVAASKYCPNEIGKAAKPGDAYEFASLVEMRESINAYFERLVESRTLSLDGLGELLIILGETIARNAPSDFRHQIALSAFRLLTGKAASRIGKCPNCHWLFLDKSKNASRVWCDMAVCGNRNKARLNYRRSFNLNDQAGR